MKTNSDIVIIIPYFGTFPIWFDLYLASCARQDNIDFVFFTDCEIPATVYGNTIFKHCTFREYCRMVSDRLDVRFSPSSPYKLCDVKPFYGIIHRDLISDYRWWGFADIDLFYGKLETIINRNNLNKYDIITTHTNRIAGHFTIVRSDSKYTRSCLKIKNWKTLLQDDRHRSVDEDEWVFTIYPEVKWIRRLYKFIFKPLGIPMKYCYEGLINKTFCNRVTRRHFHEYGTTPIPEPNETWVYDLASGIITGRNSRQIPYLHFLFFKKTPYKQRTHFWTDGFYEVPDSLPTAGRIEIDVNHIRYIK